MSTATEISSPTFATTLLVRDTCFCLHVQRAARALARRFDAALKPVGLTNGQFSLLMSLNRPDLPEIPRATMGSVSELLGMDRTTLTAAVRTLERRKLLVVLVEPTDRRGRRLVLTSAGSRLLVCALPIWTREQAELDREFEDAERLRGELKQLGDA